MNKKNNLPILIVDDEADLRDLIEITLMKMGLATDTAEGVEVAKQKIAQNPYALVLTDMRMPDGSGLEVVQYITDQKLDIPIAVITAYGNADHAVKAMKAGAFDYIQKPITLAHLRSLVKSAVNVDDVQAPTPNKSSPANNPPPPTTTEPKPESVPESTGNNTDKPVAPSNQDLSPKRLIGQSAHMQEVHDLIGKLAKTLVPVYITGESGTGKEQAARSIHEQSMRVNEPFVAVNCGAIPDSLMESEFFGYRKGSFTGANADKTGFFQDANKGTLFLDEVADLPLSMQVKLLRAIQEKAVRRIGDSNEVAVDVRIICATHKDLNVEVAEGRFRQDLFYRLNVVSITMPPLREMREDLPTLVKYLMQKVSQGQQFRIHDNAKKALMTYNYPGNIRELENILERATALGNNHTIQKEDLYIDDQIFVSQELQHPHIEAEGIPFAVGETSLQDYLDTIEKNVLELALQATHYNRTQAAKLLGISFRSMRYRLSRLDIE
jgi:two-component system response regulator PilR (NtrC family)